MIKNVLLGLGVAAIGVGCYQAYKQYQQLAQKRAVFERIKQKKIDEKQRADMLKKFFPWINR